MAASTKAAVSIRLRSGTTATHTPNLRCCSGIGIAVCSITALRLLRSATITGSKLSHSASCRYGGNAGGRLPAVVNVASSPAMPASTR